MDHQGQPLPAATVSRPRSKARQRGKRSSTDSLRGVVAVKLKDGSTRYRASIPGGRRGAKQWSPLLESAELAAEFRRRAMEKLEGLPSMMMTFEQAIEVVRTDFGHRCRPATLEWFDYQVPALREHFGRMLVAAIKPQDVERFAAKLVGQKIAPGTVHHRRRALRAVLSHATGQLPNGDPLTKARKGIWPKLRKGKVTAPEPAIIRDFLKQVRESRGPRARQDHDLVAALYLTGLRRSELARLRCEDLRPDESRIFVTGKNRDEWLAVNTEAMATLQRMGARVDGKGVLVPGGVEEIKRVMRGRSDRTGIDLTPHALRRAFVTSLIRAGHDVATVARYSRHSTDEIQRYMAANEDDARVLASVTLDVTSSKKSARGRKPRATSLREVGGSESEAI